MKKLNFIAATLVASTLSLGLIGNMSKAQASSLVPTTEGEIKLTNNPGSGCLSNATCIDTTSLGYTVSSQAYNANYLPSLLFSDKSSTVNTYDILSNPALKIKFTNPDAGTNPTAIENWFRPVALKKNGTGFTLPENGELEVGRYTFDFLGKTISELELSFFDTEQAGTSILSVNGNPFIQAIAAGIDGNIKTVKLANVQSLQLQLGSIGGSFKHGDGVLLKVSTPEPESIVSLGALALVGMFGLRQCKKSSQAA